MRPSAAEAGPASPAPGAGDRRRDPGPEAGDDAGARPATDRAAPRAARDEAAPAAPEDPEQEADDLPRGAAAVLYALVALTAVGLVLGPLGALVIWRVRRAEPFVDLHGRQALDVALSALLLGGGVFLAALALRQPLVEWAAYAVVAYYFLLTLVGGALALRGSARRLPWALPLLRGQAGR